MRENQTWGKPFDAYCRKYREASIGSERIILEPAEVHCDCRAIAIQPAEKNSWLHSFKNDEWDEEECQNILKKKTKLSKISEITKQKQK